MNPKIQVLTAVIGLITAVTSLVVVILTIWTP